MCLSLAGSPAVSHILLRGTVPSHGSDSKRCVAASEPNFSSLRARCVPTTPRWEPSPGNYSLKGVSRRYEAVALTDNVRFVGNVTVGRDVSIEELQSLYDAVVLALPQPAELLDVAQQKTPAGTQPTTVMLAAASTSPTATSQEDLP